MALSRAEEWAKAKEFVAEHADELNAQARAKGARLRERMAADR